MVMADDDEDSENDCLYIDESPTEPKNQETTSQNTPTPTNKARNERAKNCAEVPLMQNVFENIPYDIPNDQTVEVKQKARITCKDFSKKPFDTEEPFPLLKTVNEMTGSDTNEKIEESALYHYLTTDNAVHPEQECTNIPNEGHQNPYKLELKQLLDAPSRPPTKPYPTVPTGTPYRRSNIQSNSRDPKTPPLTDVQNRKQLPHIQANQTSVIVRVECGSPAGATIALKPRSGQQANNIPTTMRVNGYPIQNGQPGQLNSDASIKQIYSHTETRTEYIGQTSMSNLGMPLRTCELNCPCRNGGPIPTFPLNTPTGRDRGLTKQSLVNSQLQPKKRGRGRPRKNAANPHPTGRKGSIDMPSLNTHPPNPALNSYFHGRKGETKDMPLLNNQVISPKVNPDRSGLTTGPLDMPSLSPQPITPNLNGSTKRPTDMPYLNPNLNARTETPMDLPSANLTPNNRTEQPTNVPPLNSNFNGSSEGPMGMPRLNPNLNAMSGGAMPHLHSQSPMNPASNPNPNGTTEGPMDMPPNLNSRTERPMNIAPVHPHPSINRVSNLYLHGKTGGQMDIPLQSHQQQNAHLPINPERQMNMPLNLYGRTAEPMIMSHLDLNSSLNPVLNLDPHGRTGGPMDMPPQQHLNFHRPINSERPMNVPHLNPNLSERERTLNIHQHSMNMYLLHQLQSSNLSTSPINQSINPLKMREEREEDPIILSFNAQHQTTNSYLNHQFDGKKGHSINMSPFNPLQQPMNSLNSQPVHNTKMPPCYQCATCMPCENRSASSHPNAQTGVAMTNSQTVSRNHYERANNRKDSTPQNSGYSDEEIKKANYLASLRSQQIETAYSDMLNPSFPNNNAPRLNTTANLRAARVNSLNSAGLAGMPTHNNPTSNGVYNPAQPYVSPPRTYPTPNWAAFRTHHTVTEQRASKTVYTTMTANKVAAEKAREIPVLLSMSQTLPPTIITEIPHIDLTVDLNQNINMNITPNIIPVPLNTNAQKQTVNMRIDTTETNIATTAHNINTINLMQVPLVENQSRQIPINVNNHGGFTNLTEASAHPQTLTEDKAQTSSEQPWINIKSDGEKIPLIMDEEDIKNNVEKTIQSSVIKITDAIAKSDKSEAFVQQIRNDMDVEAAVAQLHASTVENKTNVTETSKAPMQSAKAYEIVSITSVKSETMPQNINCSNISRSGTINAKANTTLTVSTKQVIENTVTVSIVKQIVTNPNIALPETDTLVDILNKAQQNSTKPFLNIDQTDKSNIVTVNDSSFTKEEKVPTREDISLTTEEDKANISLLNILSRVKQTATKICSNNDQTNKSTIGNYNENISPKKKKAQTRAMELSRIEDKNKINDNNMPVGNGNEKGKSHETKELCDSIDDEKLKIARQNLARLRVTDNEKENERNAQEIDPEINEVDEPRENTNNESNDVLKPSIDELIFFKFQINFFRLVQERLSKINNEEFADKLHNDILDLITLSEDIEANADMPYECHECHNVTLFSPRQLYYYGSEIRKDNTKNCQLCITFRKKYIEVLIKYIKQETSLGTNNNEITENTENNNRRDDSATGFNNVGQTHSETALHNDGDDNSNKDKKSEQQSLVTGEVLSCSKPAETGDKESHNMKNTVNSQLQTNNFVVKLPLNRLKESTLKALMQCKRAKSSDNVSDENLSAAIQDNNGKGNNNSSDDPRERNTKKPVTTFNGERHVSTTLNNNYETHCIRIKGNNAIFSQNNNTNNSATTTQGSDNRRSSTENPPGPNPRPTNGDTNTSLNIINKNNANEDEAICEKTAISVNCETQNINQSNVSQNRDSNMNQKGRTIKRKSISAATAPTANPDPRNRNTSTISNILHKHNTNEEKHSKKRKVVSVGSENITSPDVEKQHSNTSADNKNYNDRNQERHSKKRKSSIPEVAPSKNPEPQNRNLNNVSEKNDDNQERHSKKRKSISAETPTLTDPHDRHDNCKSNEKDLGANKSICDEITTTENKGNCHEHTPPKNNKVHKTMPPCTNKSNETSTSNNVDSLKSQIITISNNCNGNTNKKQLCNSDKDAEIRRSVNAATTTNRTTNQLNVQDNVGALSKNKDNDTNIERSESRKITSTNIAIKSQTTPSSNATSTDKTQNNTTQNDNNDTAEHNHVSININGEKQNNNLDTRKDNEQAENIAINHNKPVVEHVDATKNNNNKKHNNNTRKGDENDEEEDYDENCTEVIKKALEDCFKKLKARGDSNNKELLGDFFKKLGETLCPKDSNDLPEVHITGKQEKKKQKVFYKYNCYHCSYSFRTLEACKSHVADGHKKAEVLPKDCVEMRKCDYCTRYVQPNTVYNNHLKKHHKDKLSQVIRD